MSSLFERSFLDLALDDGMSFDAGFPLFASDDWADNPAAQTVLQAQPPYLTPPYRTEPSLSPIAIDDSYRSSAFTPQYSSSPTSMNRDSIFAQIDGAYRAGGIVPDAAGVWSRVDSIEAGEATLANALVEVTSAYPARASSLTAVPPAIFGAVTPVFSSLSQFSSGSGAPRPAVRAMSPLMLIVVVGAIWYALD